MSYDRTTTTYGKGAERSSGHGYGSLSSSYSKEKNGDEEDVEVYIESDKHRKYTSSEFRLKVAQSVALNLGILVIGLGNAIVGPTLLDLQITANADTTSISYIFIGRSIGGVVGTCIAGPLVERMNRWLFCGLSVLLSGVFLLIAPLIPNIFALVADFCMVSGALNAFDTAATMTILWVWGDENGPWMQAFHCFYALGGLIAPVIAKPFLLPVEELSTPSSNLTNMTYTPPMMTSATDAVTQPLVDSFTWSLTSESPLEPDTEIWKCYLIMACLAFVSTITFVILLLLPKQSNVAGVISGGAEEEEGKKREATNSKSFFITMLIFVCVFCLLFSLLQMTSMSYLFTYVVEYLHMSKQTAADINTAFWVAFMAGRVLGIFIVKIIPVSIIMLLGNIIITAALVVMVFFSSMHPAVIWVSVSVLALVMGPLFATNITWTQQYVSISGLVGSCFLACASIGESIGPILIGALSGDYGFVTFGYMLLADAALGTILFIIMQTFAWAYTKHSSGYVSEEEVEHLIKKTNGEKPNEKHY